MKPKNIRQRENSNPAENSIDAPRSTTSAIAVRAVRRMHDDDPLSTDEDVWTTTSLLRTRQKRRGAARLNATREQRPADDQRGDATALATARRGAQATPQTSAGRGAATTPHPFLPTRFETPAQASWRRWQLVGRLQRHHSPEAQDLGRIIAACAPASPCKSGACPVCQRRSRFHLLRDVAQLLRGRGRLLRLSWIPTGGRVPVGELAAFNLRQFLASRQRALQRALPGVVIFGGADVSLNTFNNGNAIWQVHVYVILVARTSKELRERVRQHCPGEPMAKRPFQFNQVFEPAGALSYAVKAIVTRRSGYIGRNGRHDTESQPLPANAAVEAALYQARWPMTKRLLLRGMRIVYRAERPYLISNLSVSQSARVTEMDSAVRPYRAYNKPMALKHAGSLL